MSAIITPKDTITITIDNTKVPASAEMRLSRELPAPYVAMILCQLSVKLLGEQMARLMQSYETLKKEVTQNGETP